MKALSPTLACIALTLCATHTHAREGETTVTVIDDKALKAEFEEKMAALVKSGGSTPYATLKEQLERKSCKLELPATGTETLPPAKIYQQRLNSTLMLGRLHHCSSKRCEKTHASIASGVVIREDGIVLTNHHVVAGGDEHTLGIGAMTHDGKAFLVEEILAADEKSDAAILKLANAQGLAAAPVFRDEPVGNPVTIISNPSGKFFTLTQGYVSRYHVNSKGAPMMNVTADYAKGSSGGPIFNSRGDVIGLVANTVSIPYRHIPLHVDEESDALEIAGKGKKTHMHAGKPLTIGSNHQMTFKNSVPSRAILNLIEP